MLGRNSAVNQTGTPSSVSDRSPHLSSIPCPLSQLLRLRADVSRKPTSQPSKKWREEKKRGLSSLGYDAGLHGSSPATEIRFSLFRDRDVHWFSPADRDGRSVYCNRRTSPSLSPSLSLFPPSSFDSLSLKRRNSIRPRLKFDFYLRKSSSRFRIFPRFSCGLTLSTFFFS